MTNKEAKLVINSIKFILDNAYYSDDVENALNMAISALEGEGTDATSRKGVFIPDITVEMFRNASLEGVEDLMASGEMEDISLPSAQPEQRWIPCSERLPEENRYVLICTKHQDITDGRHERGTWWIAWDDRCYYDEENLILAWMPMPEPYKEEGKNATD